MKKLFDRLASVWGVIAFCGLLFQCSNVISHGSLVVQFDGQGHYDIYKIASESPLQFVSEQSGEFNKAKDLSPGSYLILADCSSQVINVYPRSHTKLVAHRLNFMPMQPFRPGDKFSIQCQRSERTRSWQHLTNQFSLSVLSGTRDLLVGMVPLTVNLPEESAKGSQLVSYVLSSVTVASSMKEGDTNDEFFLAPELEMAPYTEGQKLQNKLYVLKGPYKVQLNGTEMKIDLKEGEGRKIIPAIFQVEVSPQAPIDLAAKIKGSPLYAELNGEHYLNLNFPYMILPGSFKLRLSTSLRALDYLAKEGESIKVKARNVIVSLNCNDNDWTCLGSRKVRLYERGKLFPFAESVTDIPVLFLVDQVSVGVEGSRNITYELSSADNQRLNVGFLEVSPTPSHKPGMLTDLVRVETSGGQSLKGSSLDLQLDKPSLIPLIAGQYQLAQYTFFSADGSRRKSSQSVTIAPGQKSFLEITTFLSEKRFSQLEPTKSEEPAEKSQGL